MKAECIAAVRQAALMLGKELGKNEVQGIEAKVIQAQKQLAKQDIAAWRAMTRAQQLEKAGEIVVQDAIHAAIKKRQRAELTIMKRNEREAIFGKMIAGGMTRMEALTYYTFFKADGRGGILSLESLAKGYEAKALGHIQAMQELEHTSLLGSIMTNKKAMIDYLNESYGIDSGNQLAKKAFKQVEEMRKLMIDEFNRKGGDIHVLANYRNPQNHDPYHVVKAGGKGGKDFIDDHMQWVDRDEYVNPDGTPMNDTHLRAFLKEAYITISTDGKSKPPGEGGSGSIANRMRAHRQLHYKSPDAYLASMEKYGSANVFDQTRAMLTQLGKDIAMVDRFGPNAIHEFDVEYAKAIHEGGKEKFWNGHVSKTFARFSGQQGVDNVVVAHTFQQIRNAMVASRLGSMLLSQLADAGTLEATARAMNIPASEIALWGSRIVSDSKLRKALRYQGLGVETALNGIARFADDTSKAGFFGHAATAIPIIQGAHVWTRFGRQAFGASMEANLGDMAVEYKSLAELPELDRRTMESKGVTEADFALWKIAKPTEYKGSKLLGADAIDAVPISEVRKLYGLKSNAAALEARADAAVKLQSMLVEETHMAVLQPSELQSFNLRRGHIPSEMMSLVAQFKTFPWAIFRQHFLDRANMEAAGFNPWVYRARLLATTSILGGVALLLNDLATGRDPREIFPDESDPDRKKKWATFGAQAVLKGGGLGYFADIAEAMYGIGESPYKISGLLGPAGGYVGTSVAPMTYHGIQALASGDKKETEKFTRYAYDSIKGITPGQNLWYVKGVLHNVLLHDLHEMAAPGYAERARDSAKKNFESEYWLGMGRDTRPPNFANIAAD